MSETQIKLVRVVFLLGGEVVGSNEKNPGRLGYVGDYTTQFYRDYKDPYKPISKMLMFQPRCSRGRSSVQTLWNDACSLPVARMVIGGFDGKMVVDTMKEHEKKMVHKRICNPPSKWPQPIFFEEDITKITSATWKGHFHIFFSSF